MKLKERLAHVGLGARPAQPSLQPSSEGSSSPLSTLRATMKAALGELGSAEPVRGSPSPSLPLPFARVSTESGVLHQRIELQHEAEKVGKIALSTATQARGDVLSLLALDPSFAALDPRRALFFDTETTGLGGAGTVAFLVGLGWFDEEGRLCLEQLLLRSPADEDALLGRIVELIERSSFLVSFNGRSFDWPLLQGRCVMNRRAPLPKLPHFDLLHVARRLHKRRLERFRLVDLEREVLQFERPEDDIPGVDIAPRYLHFLRTSDEEVLRAVVDHNAWDVLSMVALLGLYGGPWEAFSRSDLLGLAQTFGRGRAYDFADRALLRAGVEDPKDEAFHLRARLHQARGDKARALADYQAIHEQVDDPSVRFSLVKLLEHYARDFEQAISVANQGTGEAESAIVKRRLRLARKLERLQQKKDEG